MYHARHARPHRYAVPAALAVLAVVLAGLGVGLVLQREVGRPAPHADVTAAVPKAAVPQATRPAGTGEPGPLERCRRQYDAQDAVLATARRSIRQWQVHVEAMNRLVAGTITLAQASRFWARTRVGSQRRVAAFTDAEKDYARHAYDCPAPQAGQAAPLRGCAGAVALRDDVDLLARRAIDTWSMHIADMERLRRGQITPQQATRMWIRNWHRGQRQIDAYQAALRRAEAAPDCAG